MNCKPRERGRTLGDENGRHLPEMLRRKNSRSSRSPRDQLGRSTGHWSTKTWPFSLRRESGPKTAVCDTLPRDTAKRALARELLALSDRHSSCSGKSLQVEGPATGLNSVHTGQGGIPFCAQQGMHGNPSRCLRFRVECGLNLGLKRAAAFGLDDYLWCTADFPVGATFALVYIHKSHRLVLRRDSTQPVYPPKCVSGVLESL
jgi:hypothetical protein